MQLISLREIAVAMTVLSVVVLVYCGKSSSDSHQRTAKASIDTLTRKGKLIVSTPQNDTASTAFVVDLESEDEDDANSLLSQAEIYSRIKGQIELEAKSIMLARELQAAEIAAANASPRKVAHACTVDDIDESENSVKKSNTADEALDAEWLKLSQEVMEDDEQNGAPTKDRITRNATGVLTKMKKKNNNCNVSAANDPTGSDANELNDKIENTSSAIVSVATANITNNTNVGRNNTLQRSTSSWDTFKTNNNRRILQRRASSSNAYYNNNIITSDTFKHVVDKPSTVFGEDVLRKHNHYRAKHGVRPLIYSAAISKYSQNVAYHFAQHDTRDVADTNPDGYGENVYELESSKIEDGDEIVKRWYNEIVLHDFKNEVQLETELASAHFTQIIWKASRKLGIGISQKKEGIGFYIVCNYYPRGNIIGAFLENVPERKISFLKRLEVKKRGINKNNTLIRLFQM